MVIINIRKVKLLILFSKIVFNSLNCSRGRGPNLLKVNKLIESNDQVRNPSFLAVLTGEK